MILLRLDDADGLGAQTAGVARSSWFSQVQLVKLSRELEFQLDEAAIQGQIDCGNHRAASSLLIAAYRSGLRKAIVERLEPEGIITHLEPQIAVVLAGLNFRVIPGFADGDAETSR